MILEKHKRWLSAVIAIVMIAGVVTPAIAAEPGSVPVELTAQPANFSVTLPTVLPVDVNAEGTVTVALDATITNNSAGPITLASAKVTPKNSWNLVSMDTDFAKLPAGTKSIGFTLFNKEVHNSGTADISAISLINGNSSIGLPYGSKLTTQKEALTEQPLDVLFTVGWYKGGNSVVDSPEALLALDKENLSMMVGAEETITATFVEKETPKGRSAFMLSNVDGVTFTSTNDEVATVDSNGLITAVGKGTAKVIATARGLDATCNITVNALKVPLSAIDVNKTNVTLNKGTTEKLVLMYNPTKFDTNATVTWSSNDTNVATVSPLTEEHDGTTGTPSYATITAVNGGNTVVTVNVVSGDNTFSKVINVTVNEPMTGLDMPSSLEVNVDDTVNIIANKLPSNTTDTSVITYKSNDPSIATINSAGLITGINEGNTIITLKCGYFEKTIKVTVSLNVPEPSIGTKYIEGNYEYSYGQKYEISYEDASRSWVDSQLSGWGARLIDNSQTNYIQPKEKINSFPVVSYSALFSNYPNSTLTLTGNWDTSNITSMSQMFYSSQATTLNLNNLNTSHITDMESMFAYSKATTLDLSSFDTSNVTNMNRMFAFSQATSLDLSNFDTSKVTDMMMMFRSSKATTLNLSSFNTSNVTNMYGMFTFSLPTTLDLSSFNTSNVTNMESMFANSKTTSLDLSSFDTTKVTNMESMFANSKTTSLDLSSFDTTKVANMTGMFANCKPTTGYARTQTDADKFNNSSSKPSTLTFVVK